jgi:lysozyme
MMTVAGIDISHWQSTTPPLNGLGFVFVRATYGAYRDGLYAMHADAVRRAGLVLGAYIFGRATPVADQVAAFLGVGGEADLLVLDLERDTTASSSMSLDQARSFIAAIHARGRRIGLYHSESGFAELGQDFDWVANWSREPTRHWDFWQYQGSPLDRDLFHGSTTELRALVSPPTAPTPTPAPTGPVASAPGRNNVAIRYSPVSATRSRLALRKGTRLYEKPGGLRVTAMSRDGRVPHVGLAGRVAGKAWRAVIVGTRWSYRDGKPHATVLYVPASAGKVVPA